MSMIKNAAAAVVRGVGSVKKAAAVVVAGAGSAVAFAQAADPFSTVLTEVTGKVSTYAAALVGLAAVGVGFMVAVKYVKKIRSAA